MSFVPNIPTTGQTLGGTRVAINGNFASLRSTISNGSQPNHIDVNSTGPGKHIFVQMPVQTAGAANLPASGEGGLITQRVVATGNSELFYARDGVATYTQLTTGNPTAATPGSTYLPGGIVLKWGGYPTAGDGANINFASAFPTICWGVVITVISGSDVESRLFVNQGSVSKTKFTTGKVGASNYPIFYYAIGN